MIKKFFIEQTVSPLLTEWKSTLTKKGIKYEIQFNKIVAQASNEKTRQKDEEFKVVKLEIFCHQLYTGSVQANLFGTRSVVKGKFGHYAEDLFAEFCEIKERL